MKKSKPFSIRGASFAFVGKTGVPFQISYRPFSAIYGVNNTLSFRFILKKEMT